jgi:hypothetical protein
VFLGAACLALGMVCAVGQFVPGFVQLLELLAVVCWSLSPAAQVLLSWISIVVVVVVVFFSIVVLCFLQLLRSRREGSEGLARSLVGLWLVGAILSTVSRFFFFFFFCLVLFSFLFCFSFLFSSSRWRNDEGVVSLVGSVVHVALLIGMVYQLFANRRKFKAHDF